MNAPVPIQNALPPALYQLDQMERMAAAIAKSGLFGVKDATQALALMLVAQAEGQHPATVAQEYDIIKGKASRKTHSVLARFQAAGGTVKWHQLDDSGAVATFSHPQGGSVTIDWTVERAQRTIIYEDGKRMPLSERAMYKDGYPRAMFRARCIAEGVRAVYPAALGGMLVPEEAQDPMPTEEKDITAEGATLPVATTAVGVQMPKSKSEPPPRTEPRTERKDPPPVDDGPIKESQLKLIRAKMAGAALSDIDLIAKFGQIDTLKSSQVNAILDWIKNPVPGGDEE